MNTYDPLKSPDAEEWLTLDEQERIALVQRHHKKARIAMPNTIVHASMHAVVENQLAEGMPAVNSIRMPSSAGSVSHCRRIGPR
jgi:hypothetical protein